MTSTEAAYSNVISQCLVGELVNTRNSECFRTFDVHQVFYSTPLVSARKTAWKNCLREWQWFMSGSSNIADLHESVRSWWAPWADERGCVAFNYSQQLRSSYGVNDGVDQVSYLLQGLREHPYSRRNVATTWNTADMVDQKCKITNCHGTVIQLIVDTKSCVHLLTYQRSVDVICGLPHNWLQYWAFLLWLARHSGLGVGSLRWTGGDVHVYKEHLPLANEILGKRLLVENTPTLVYSPTSDDFLADDFFLDEEYQPLITTRARMIV